MNKKMAPLLAIEFGAAAHIKVFLHYSLLLIVFTLIGVDCLIWEGYEIIATKEWSPNVSLLSPIIHIGFGIIVMLALIPWLMRITLTIGDIYFFEDFLCIRRFIFLRKMRRLRYTDIEFHRLISYQPCRMAILISPYKGKNPLAGFWNLMTKCSFIRIKKQEDVQNLLSFLASKHIDTIANNGLDIKDISFGKSN